MAMGEPFEMNVKIEQGSDFVVDNSAYCSSMPKKLKKVSDRTVVR